MKLKSVYGNVFILCLRMLSKLKCRLMRMRFIGDTGRKMKSWNGHMIPPA